jgi:hypothetical protein
MLTFDESEFKVVLAALENSIRQYEDSREFEPGFMPVSTLDQAKLLYEKINKIYYISKGFTEEDIAHFAAYRAKFTNRAATEALIEYRRTKRLGLNYDPTEAASNLQKD